jgi:hypothetical protein
MGIAVQISFDAENAPKLAEFWAVALDYVVQPPPEGFQTWEQWASANNIPPETWDNFSAVIDPAGKGPRLLFQKVPEGKAAKNRMHLDVNASAGVDDHAEKLRAVTTHVERLVEHGATLVAEKDENGEHWVVMRDPEGNEFCVQ